MNRNGTLAVYFDSAKAKEKKKIHNFLPFSFKEKSYINHRIIYLCLEDALLTDLRNCLDNFSPKISLELTAQALLNLIFVKYIFYK